jgi:hypothetical protein
MLIVPERSRHPLTGCGTDALDRRGGRSAPRPPIYLTLLHRQSAPTPPYVLLLTLAFIVVFVPNDPP